MSRPGIRPVVWQPPPVPARSRQRSSSTPLPPLRLMPVNGFGPEDVLVDADGALVTGVADGRVLRLSIDGQRIEQLADTGGRPLGIEQFSDGRLLVCDAHRGLVAVDPTNGAVEVLVEDVAGERMLFCNNAAVASDGTVYFTDSSTRFGIEHWRADIIEHSGTGRLLRRDPDGAVDVVLDGLEFANGVALTADESAVVVAESGSYRLTRLWLTGEPAGHSEAVAPNLPGFPDNIARGSDGLIWVAMASSRNPLLDRLHRRHPVLRRAAWSLPERLQPGETRTVWVLAVDADGTIVHDLQGSDERYHMVTGVREHHGTVYLASLVERALGALDLPR